MSNGDEFAKTSGCRIVVDEAGTVLDVETAAPDARYVRGMEAGDNILARIAPEDRCFFELTCRWVAVCGEARIQIRWLRSEGHRSHLLARLRSEGPGRVEVTLRRDELHAARRAEMQLRHVVEGSARGIVVRTADEILYLNDAFAHLVGFANARECLTDDTNPNGRIHPDDRALVAKHLKARLAGEEALSQYTLRLVRRDGSIIWVEANAALVEWDGVRASISWLTDVTDRKAMEEEQLKSREAAEYANRSKTDFLANMSHELRTPLNAIIGFSELIMREIVGPIDPRYRGYAKDIHASGQHLLAIINDLLDLSKLEAGKMELRESLLLPGEVVDECLALLHERARQSAVHLVKGPVCASLLRADRRAVKQILLNLLSNAVKFTPEGGTVTVSAAAGPDGIAIAVADTGIGMSESDIQIALAPFGQIDSGLARKHEGTGLGLPLCKSLVELHGGTLNVVSKLDMGTTITVRFPPERTAAQSDAA